MNITKYFSEHSDVDVDSSFGPNKDILVQEDIEQENGTSNQETGSRKSLKQECGSRKTHND